MIKSLNFLFLSLLAILTISCSNEDTDIEYDYLPVKLVGSEMWSILNVQTGEVLYKDEFKNMPSAIYHDLFLVENDKGTFDYYNINNVKTPVNKASFYMAADFVGSDVTPATLPGKQITLINTKCEVVATLDKSIEQCGKFVEGLAMFMDETGKCGFLDKTGKIVIKAKYDNGLSFSDGVSVCWLVDEDEDLTTYYVIDKTGKELFKFTSNEYVIAGAFNEGRIPVFKDKEIIYLDKTGKKLQSLCNLEDTINYSSNLFNYNIFALRDGRSVFCEGDVFGLKDKESNIILRAKYDLLINSGYGDGRYIAQKGDKFGIIDFNDNVVLDFKYDEIFLLRRNVFLVGNGKTRTLINDKGEDVTNVNISEFSLQRMSMVKSNFLDPDAFVQKIMDDFTDDSCAGYKNGTTLGDVKSELDNDAGYYSYETELTVAKGNADRPVTLTFDRYLALPRYTYETYYYESYRVPDGYGFNYDAELAVISMEYDISEHENMAQTIAEKFDAALSAKGYKKLANGFMEAPNGTAVGLGYKGGTMSLTYSFNKENYEGLARIVRGSDGGETQEDSVVPNSNLQVDVELSSIDDEATVDTVEIYDYDAGVEQ